MLQRIDNTAISLSHLVCYLKYVINYSCLWYVEYWHPNSIHPFVGLGHAGSRQTRETYTSRSQTTYLSSFREDTGGNISPEYPI